MAHTQRKDCARRKRKMAVLHQAGCSANGVHLGRVTRDEPRAVSCRQSAASLIPSNSHRGAVRGVSLSEDSERTQATVVRRAGDACRPTTVATRHAVVAIQLRSSSRVLRRTSGARRQLVVDAAGPPGPRPPTFGIYILRRRVWAGGQTRPAGRCQNGVGTHYGIRVGVRRALSERRFNDGQKVARRQRHLANRTRTCGALGRCRGNDFIAARTERTAQWLRLETGDTDRRYGKDSDDDRGGDDGAVSDSRHRSSRRSEYDLIVARPRSTDTLVTHKRQISIRDIVRQRRANECHRTNATKQETFETFGTKD